MEIVKHGLIADRDYYYQVQENNPENIPAEVIYHYMEIKNKVVTVAPFEKDIWHDLRTCSAWSIIKRC